MNAVTIVSDQHGWFVMHTDSYSVPSTAAERALSPDDFAQLVAERVGGVYVAPKPVSVSAFCGCCGGPVSALRSKPVPDCCWFCAQGAVTSAERDRLLESQRVRTQASMAWDWGYRKSMVLTPVEVAA